MASSKRKGFLQRKLRKLTARFARANISEPHRGHQGSFASCSTQEVGQLVSPSGSLASSAGYNNLGASDSIQAATYTTTGDLGDNNKTKHRTSEENNECCYNVKKDIVDSNEAEREFSKSADTAFEKQKLGYTEINETFDTHDRDHSKLTDNIGKESLSMTKNLRHVENQLVDNIEAHTRNTGNLMKRQSEFRLSAAEASEKSDASRSLLSLLSSDSDSENETEDFNLCSDKTLKEVYRYKKLNTTGKRPDDTTKELNLRCSEIPSTVRKDRAMPMSTGDNQRVGSYEDNSPFQELNYTSNDIPSRDNRTERNNTRFRTKESRKARREVQGSTNITIQGITISNVSVGNIQIGPFNVTGSQSVPGNFERENNMYSLPQRRPKSNRQQRNRAPEEHGSGESLSCRAELDTGHHRNRRGQERVNRTQEIQSTIRKPTAVVPPIQQESIHEEQGCSDYTSDVRYEGVDDLQALSSLQRYRQELLNNPTSQDSRTPVDISSHSRSTHSSSDSEPSERSSLHTQCHDDSSSTFPDSFKHGRTTETLDNNHENDSPYDDNP